MPESIVIDIPALYGWCLLIAAIGVAVGWIVKVAKPITKPIKDMRCELDQIKDMSLDCARKFDNDHRRLQKLERNLEKIEEDNRVSMISIALLLKHAETGNCTGEVAKGRSDLESYLIHRNT